MISRPSYRVMSRLVKYNPETGEFIRMARPAWLFDRHKHSGSRAHSAKYWNARYSNQPAFTSNSRGYWIGTFLGKKMKAHRVAWLLHYGEWPTDHIDHINGDPGDNRIANLRIAPQLINQKNAKRPKNNKSGVVGVFWSSQSRKWRAEIKVNYKTHHLGMFEHLGEAEAARKAAEAELGFHKNHGRNDL